MKLCGKYIMLFNGLMHRMVSSVVNALLLVREAFGSNPGPVKSDALSPPLRRFVGAVLPKRLPADMCPATRYTLRRNATSLMTILFDLIA